jgi:hypothetical protein
MELPDEALFTILLNSSDVDLEKLSLVNKQIREIYQSDYFKQERLKYKIVEYIEKIQLVLDIKKRFMITINHIDKLYLLKILPLSVTDTLKLTDNDYTISFYFWEETNEIDLFIRTFSRMNEHIIINKEQVIDILFKLFTYIPSAQELLYDI